MFKKITLCVVVLLAVSTLSFAEDEEQLKKTKTVCYNVAPQPQPGPNTIENSYVRRVCVEVEVEVTDDDSEE